MTDCADCDINQSIELPTEMWCEILKHFDIEKREQDVTRREAEVEQRDRRLRQIQRFMDDMTDDLQQLSGKIRPLCGKIDEQLTQLGESVNQKIILLEPQVAGPMQNLQRYNKRLKELIRFWYI